VKLEILPDGEAVARRAADIVATLAREAVAARGQFLLAMSGGSTPWRMMQLLALSDVPWQQAHIFQVDERVAPAGDPSRNMTHLHNGLLVHVPLPQGQLYEMPVGNVDLAAAADGYAATLAKIAGIPAVLDLVHLGLGIDGHTASLVPGDPVLEAGDRDVAVTQPYQGQRRITLTFPVINRARSVLWVVVGADKRDALSRLQRGDRSIPAGCVLNSGVTILADTAAAGGPPQS